MSKNGSIEDRQAIRERIEAYGDAVFRADGQAWIANWSHDPVWSLPGFEVRGRDAILSAWTHGRESPALLGLDWPSLWHRTPDHIREDIGLTTYVSPYPADLFEQLRAA